MIPPLKNQAILMDKVIDMFRKILLTLTTYFMVVMLLPASASAAPQYKKSDIELMYQTLLTLEKAKTASKRNARGRLKPSLQKASFRPMEKSFSRNLVVTATAYTSHAAQTDSTPNIAAWGDRLRPGMKAIAVSRDLLKVYGLKHKQKVRIKGLKGEYVVLDKMHKRWRKKIDIYMGKDKRKAFRWGRRKVEIQWN